MLFVEVASVAVGALVDVVAVVEYELQSQNQNQILDLDFLIFLPTESLVWHGVNGGGCPACSFSCEAWAATACKIFQVSMCSRRRSFWLCQGC